MVAMVAMVVIRVFAHRIDGVVKIRGSKAFVFEFDDYVTVARLIGAAVTRFRGVTVDDGAVDDVTISGAEEKIRRRRIFRKGQMRRRRMRMRSKSRKGWRQFIMRS